MEKRFGAAQRVWVMDRGMISAENLAWLREGGRKYVLATPRTELKRREQELVAKDGWQHVRAGLEVKLCPPQDGGDTYVLCRSEDRRLKERATHDRFRRRIRERLGSLGRRLKSASRKLEAGPIERQIGRILGANSRAAGHLTVALERDARRTSGLRLALKCNRAWRSWAEITEGAYLLRTNVAAWTPEELWRTYVQLSEAEAAFRIEKSDLQLRPIWHQQEKRVRAHILVCFLAHALWKTMQAWQRAAGLGSSPRHLLNELGRIQTADVVLPFVTGGETRVRCVVRPDKDQAALLDRLGLTLPKRLKEPKNNPM
jgi:transposase